MKKAIYFIGLAFALLLAAASCQKAPFLTFNGQKSFTFKDTGGSETITFSCNRAWTAKSSESWITVSPAQGDANEEGVRVTITCAANTTYDPRNATVTIMSEGLTETITIEQEQKDAIFVNENIYSFPSTGGTATIKGSANVDVLIEIPSEYSSWISAPQTKGLVDFSRDVIVQPNDTYVDKEATIYVTEKKSNIRQAVTIKEAQLDYIQLCDKELAANRVDTTIVMKVKYNIDFTPAVDVDWISLEPATFTMEGATRGADGLVEAELNVHFAENPSFLHRKGTIMNSSGSIESIVVCEQSPYGFVLFDNYYYKTVKYGTTDWMVESLKTKFGYDNPPMNYGALWEYPGTADGSDKFGLLYSNEAIHNYNLKNCPDGWHLSNWDDWQVIIDLVGPGKAMDLVRVDCGGTDYFNFGGEITSSTMYVSGNVHYASWHTNDYDAMSSGMKIEKVVTLDLENGTISCGQEPFPSSYPHSMRCVKGIVNPIIKTNPATNISSESCILSYKVEREGNVNIIKRGFRYGLSADNLNYEVEIIEASSNSTLLTELSPVTTYYYDAFCKYEGGEVCGGILNFTTPSATKVDYNGYSYKTIFINGKEYFVENLRTDKYNDGTAIPYLPDPKDWGMTTEGAYSYNENYSDFEEKYGKFYNGYAVNTGKLCPEGWRCLNETDFSTFNNSDALRSTECTWGYGDITATNSTGFSAIPAGFRHPGDGYEDIGMCAVFWQFNPSATGEKRSVVIMGQGGYLRDNVPYSDVRSWYGIPGYKFMDTYDNFGCSVRCVRE